MTLCNFDKDYANSEKDKLELDHSENSLRTFLYNLVAKIHST